MKQYTEHMKAAFDHWVYIATMESMLNTRTGVVLSPDAFSRVMGGGPWIMGEFPGRDGCEYTRDAFEAFTRNTLVKFGTAAIRRSGEVTAL